MNTIEHSAIQPFGEISVALLSCFFVVFGAICIVRPAKVQSWVLRVFRRLRPFVFEGIMKSEGYVSYVRLWGVLAILMGTVLLYSVFREWKGPSL
jgi:hypothetical protein